MVKKSINYHYPTKYFESIVGPARKNFGDHREYKVDGCILETKVTTDGTIKSITANLSPVCNFNWRLAFPSAADLPQPNKLKFGDVMNAMSGWKIAADCLISCGNSYDPYIDLTFGGSRADGWLLVVLTAVLDNEANLKAKSEFSKKIVDEKGEDFVVMQEYKCNYDLNKKAIGILEGMKVSSITIKSDSDKSISKDCGSGKNSESSNKKPESLNVVEKEALVVSSSEILKKVVVTEGFVVVAPEESKKMLSTMLKNATSTIKILEIKEEIENFQKPIAGNRKAARKLNEQGLLALKSNDFIQAIAVLESAKDADPADIEILNNYVYALIKANRLQAAESEAGRLLTMSPGRSSAWENLAEVYAINNKNEEAVAALVLAFQFSSNKDHTVSFLNKRASDMSSPLQPMAKKTIEIIKNISS